jgi:hypothetical protein
MLFKRAEKETFPFPGLYGWTATAAVVVAFDVWAEKTGHPTMSRTLGWYLHRPVTGPILAGAWAALAYHLLVEERLTALDQALVHSPNLPDITTPPSE